MSVIKAKFAPALVPYTAVGAANGIASLGSDGKLSAAQLPTAVASGLNFKGSFDASAGSFPASPANGDLYIVSVAGTVGGFVLAVGDYIFYSSSASAWEPIYAPKTTDQLSEGVTNLFFTAARAQSAAVINSLAASTTQAPSTTAVNTALAGKAASFTRNKERFVLSATNITNQYIILSQAALAFSIVAGVVGNGLMEESVDAGATGDYLVSIDSGTTHTKMTFKNDLASAGASPLAAGDVIFVQYAY